MLGRNGVTKGVLCPPFCIDREDKLSKQALTEFVYCGIKKPSLIVCAPSVKLGAGPLAWGCQRAALHTLWWKRWHDRLIPRVVRSVSVSRRVVFRGQSAHFLNDDEGTGTGLDFLRSVCYAVAIQYQSFARASIVSVFQSVRAFPLGGRGLFHGFLIKPQVYKPLGLW